MKYFQAVPLWGRLQVPLRHPQRRLHIQLLGSGGRKYSSSRTQVQNNSLAAPVHIKSKQRHFGLSCLLQTFRHILVEVVCCRHCSTSLLMLFVEVVCCRHSSTPLLCCLLKTLLHTLVDVVCWSCLLQTFLHTLPAHLLDLLTLAIGGKPLLVRSLQQF